MYILYIFTIALVILPAAVDVHLVQQYHISENQRRCGLFNHTDLGNKRDGVRRCPRTFDGILCWEEAEPNSWAYTNCPDWFLGFYHDNGQQVRKFCEADGKWRLKAKNGTNSSYTDYTECMVPYRFRDLELYRAHLPRVKVIKIIGFSSSLLSLIVAIASLIYLKQIHCPRVILHINLFFSFLIFSCLQLFKDITWVNNLGFPKDVIEISPGQYKTNDMTTHWECRLVTSLTRYAESANHIMVFCEALYLSSILSVSTFNPSSVNRYIAVGWLGPLSWIVPYISLMAIYSNGCWISETNFYFVLVYVLPQLLLILANFIMFVNIIRILVLKLKHNGNMTSSQIRYKKLAKSTLTMLPFFSIYYIVFSWLTLYQNSVEKSGNQISVELDLARLYFEVICSSFQGFIITCIFCFFNSEVKQEFMRIINRNILVYNTNRKSRTSNLNTKKNSENKPNTKKNLEYSPINQSISQSEATSQPLPANDKTNTPSLKSTIIHFSKNRRHSTVLGDLESLTSLKQLDRESAYSCKLEHREMLPPDTQLIFVNKTNESLSLAISKKCLSIKGYFQSLKEPQGKYEHLMKRNSSTPNVSNCSVEYENTRRNTCRKLSLDLNILERRLSVKSKGSEF